MNYQNNPATKNVQIKMSDDSLIYIEVTKIGDQPVSSNKDVKLKDVTDQIAKIGKDLAQSIKSISEDLKPDEVGLEVGLDVAVESGRLTSVLVKGTSKANFKISMKWNISST